MTDLDAAIAPLVNLAPEHAWFVGIDSDGCAFDTMEIKHKECFTPTIIRYWGLQPVSKYAREACEFVNLYSKWRGINRWPALVMVFDLLWERPEVIKRGAAIPEAASIRRFMTEATAQSNDALAEWVQRTGDPELVRALEWSRAVNAAIADMVHGVPPFPYVRESLDLMARHADAIVVSQTPAEALVREWQEHGIDGRVKAIAGQEMGTKSQHIALASQGRYARDHMLMIGDAPGDLKAARDNRAFFFPINPGHEEESWERFYGEGFHRFIEGRFGGDYEAALIAEFEKALPATPPWKR